ncbi:hypothetical protein ScPMuIL_006573 [Solemya velum]
MGTSPSLCLEANARSVFMVFLRKRFTPPVVAPHDPPTDRLNGPDTGSRDTLPNQHEPSADSCYCHKYNFSENRVNMEGKDHVLYEMPTGGRRARNLKMRRSLNRVLIQPENENPNLGVLLEYLKKCFKQNGSDSRFIIFVRTRVAAMALAEYLNCNDFRCSHLTGSGPSEEKGGMTQVDQENVIDKMKEGILKGMVATSVAEEGIDIADCNIILRYNHVQNEIATVQCKGRSRRRGGRSVLFADWRTVEREELNIIRVFLMRKAIELIGELEKTGIEEQLKTLQREIVEDEKLKDLLHQDKESKKMTGEFYLECALCKAFAVDGSYIRAIDDAHVPLDQEFLSKVKRVPIKPKLGGVIFARFRCKKCNSNWGKMMKKYRKEFPALKVEAFAFISTKTKEKNFYSKWRNIPFLIPPANLKDYKDVILKEQVPGDESGT